MLGRTLGFAALVWVLLVPAVAPNPDPSYTEEPFTLTSFDGVKIQGTLYVPTSGTPAPAVLLCHGFATDQSEVAPWARRYATLGYVALTYDARGFGKSEGLVGLNGPNEVADVRALIDYLAVRPEVRLDGPGDPRVAMGGGSYGGAIQLLTAAEDTRIDALVPIITWNNLSHALFPNDVMKTGWILIFYGLGQAQSQARLDPVLTEFLADAISTQTVSPKLRDYLWARSPASVLDRIHAPVLLVQGWRDTLFTADEANWTYRGLLAQGVPAKLLFYNGGHGYEDALSGSEYDERQQRIDAWLQYWLQRTPKPEAVFAKPVEWRSVQEGRLVPEQAWPLADASLDVFYLDGAAAPLEGRLRLDPVSSPNRALVAAGGLTSYAEAPGVQSKLPTPAMDPPGTAYTYATDPFGSAVHYAGAPRLRLVTTTTASHSFLFVKLYDVAPDGTALLLDRQVTPLIVTGTDATLAHPQPLDLTLTSLSHEFAAGHRLRLTVATSDASHAENRAPGIVALDQESTWMARIELPRYPLDRSADTNAPLLDRLEQVERANEWEVSASLRDDRGVASTFLFWNTPTAAGVAAPVEHQGDRYVFHVPKHGEPLEVRLWASDAAGNFFGQGAPSSGRGSPLLPQNPTPDASVTWVFVALMVGAVLARGVHKRRPPRAAD